MKRVLFAINNKSAEQKLSKLIKEKSEDEQYQVVGTLVSNESITDFLTNKSTDILVYIEGLNGKEDGFDYILRLHRQYPHIRIVFIAGQRTIGDKKLATLVAFHIYDIIAGQRILMSDVAEKIVNPARFEDVMMYLPEGEDIFGEASFNTQNMQQQQPPANTIGAPVAAVTPNTVVAAQDESERLAEKAGLLKQIENAENENKSLSIKLAAAEARTRELENEQVSWREEASKERLILEKNFDAEKNALSANILELSSKIEDLLADKESAQKSYNELKEKYDSQSKAVSSQQTQHSIAMKSLQNDLRATKVKLEEADTQVRELSTELKNLKASLKSERERIISEAKKKADELLEVADQKAKEAATLADELKAKLAIYGDEGFEAYKAREEEKLAQAKANLASEMAAERERQRQLIEKERQKMESAVAKRLKEADDELAAKQKEVDAIKDRIQKAEEDVRRARQDEIARMEAAIANKRREVESIESIVIMEIEKVREEKLEEIKQLEETIEEKNELVEQVGSELHERQIQLDKLDIEYTEAKRKYDSDIVTLTESYEQKTQEVREEAEKEQEEIIEESKKEIEKEKSELKEAAEQEIKEMRENAEAQAKEIIETAEAEIKEMRETAEQEISIKMASFEEDLVEHKQKIDRELEEVTRAFVEEKRRLAKEFEQYKKELIEAKKAADEEYGVTYSYNERDFITGPSVNTRCTPIMVYSPVPGTGNSTIALNVASFIAMNNRKTIYIELNAQHPTLKDQLGISIINDSVDTAFGALRNKSYEVIDQNIITKQKILNLKTNAFEMQSRYPDMLSFLTYSEDKTPQYPKITIDFIKGLVAYLKYKKHYEYIVLDVPAYFDKKTVNELYNLCTKHVISTNQDILSLNNLLNMKDHIQNLTALENSYYVVNKYVDNTVLSNRKIGEICKIRVPLTIPQISNDLVLASYRSVPVILISKSRELIAAYKAIADYAMK